ncbi:MAG: hypothetical protein NT106_13895, partial [Candidatus Sumerlaeota bacterium]|nr:hypothetical protein [Candidatus Sumerlaeota bacterium]
MKNAGKLLLTLLILSVAMLGSAQVSMIGNSGGALIFSDQSVNGVPILNMKKVAAVNEFGATIATLNADIPPAGNKVVISAADAKAAVADAISEPKLVALSNTANIFFYFAIDKADGKIAFVNAESGAIAGIVDPKIDSNGKVFKSPTDAWRGKISGVALKNLNKVTVDNLRCLTGKFCAPYGVDETIDWIEICEDTPCGVGICVPNWDEIFANFAPYILCAPKGKFNFSPVDSRSSFDIVCAYYNVDATHAFVKDCKIRQAYLERPIPTFVNANFNIIGPNAYFTWDDPGYFVLGNEGTADDIFWNDAAEDGPVVAHEYGHAAQYATHPNFNVVVDPNGDINKEIIGWWVRRGIMEGMSDHGAYMQFPKETILGNWIFGNIPYARRYANTAKHYPEDVDQTIFEDPPNECADYYTLGTVFAGAWYDASSIIGRKDSITLDYRTLAACPVGTPFSMADYCWYILNADSISSKGKNFLKILGALTSRGFSTAYPTEDGLIQASGYIHVIPVGGKGGYKTTGFAKRFAEMDNDEEGAASATPLVIP